MLKVNHKSSYPKSVFLYSLLLTQSHFRPPNVWVFFPTSTNFLTSASYPTVSWHCLLGVSVRSHKLRDQSHKTALQLIYQSSPRISPVLLIDQLSIGVLTTLPQVSKFVRTTHRTQGNMFTGILYNIWYDRGYKWTVSVHTELGCTTFLACKWTPYFWDFYGGYIT